MSHTASDKNYITDGENPGLRATVIDNGDGTKSVKVSEPTLATISSDIALIKADIASILGNQTDGDQRTVLQDANGNDINAQYPLSTDGDSIYEKDLNIAGSSIGTFTGSIQNLFNSIGTPITDSTATNPKTFTVKLNRPATSTSIKMCAPSGSTFSNTKIILKDPAGTALVTIDESGSGTAYSARFFNHASSPWCTMVVEFYTANAVSIDYIMIEKSHDVHATIVGRKPDGTSVDIQATTGGNLKVSIEEFDPGALPVSVSDSTAQATLSTISTNISTMLGNQTDGDQVVKGNVTPSDNYINPTTAEATWSLLGGWNTATSRWQRATFWTSLDGDASSAARIRVNSTQSLYNGATFDAWRGDTTYGADVDVTRLPKSATSALTSVAGSATSVTIKASNTSRVGLIVVNDSSSVLYLAYAATAAANAYTYRLNAYETFEMPPSMIYTGLVTGIWATATGNAYVTELT